MGRSKVGTRITASHPSYERLVEDALRRAKLLDEDGPTPYLAHVILDFPLTWALGRLEGLDSVLRARTLIVTQATHPVYLDCLASYHVSGVVNSIDEPALLSGVYAAATAQRTYQWRSGLTYMELRVTRALLRGMDTRSVATHLSISTKTVNAHVSNILCKSAAETRAQYVAQLLGGFPSESTGRPPPGEEGSTER
jgi:DNA-binding CsgD family transcriptional regulator